MDCDKIRSRIMTDDLSGFAAREAGELIPERIARIKCDDCGCGQAYVRTVGQPRRNYMECVNCGRWTPTTRSWDVGYNKPDGDNDMKIKWAEPTPERIAEALEGGGEVWVDAEENQSLFERKAREFQEKYPDTKRDIAEANRKAFAQRVLEAFQRVRPESAIACHVSDDDIVVRVGAGQNVAVCEYDGEQVGLNYWGMWYSEIPFDDIEENLNKVLPRLQARRIAEDGPQISAEEVREVESGYAKPIPPPPWVTEHSFVKAKPIQSDDGIICDSKPRTTADQIADMCDSIRDMLLEKCDGVRDMLLEKNRKYGDSALQPVRIFSRATPVEQILVRLDDKLSRLRSAQSDEDEDVIDDLIGYLVLLKIARSR